MSPLRQLLHDAKALIDSPEKWLKTETKIAMDAQGEPCADYDLAACRFSIPGALRRAWYLSGYSPLIYGDAYSRLTMQAQELGIATIEQLNSGVEHSIAMLTLDGCIKDAEALEPPVPIKTGPRGNYRPRNQYVTVKTSSPDPVDVPESAAG